MKLDEVMMLKKFIAWGAVTIREPIYDDPQNREGLAADFEEAATGDMVLNWLETDWQAERAIKAEKRVTEITKTLKQYKHEAEELFDQIHHQGMKLFLNHLIAAIDQIITKDNDESVY